MIKQIINWTAGGFFRTLGKFLMFLLVGILFTLLLSKSDTKIGHLLGIGYVYADTINTSSNEYLVQTCTGPSLCDYTIGNSTYNTGYINMNTQFQNNHGPNDTKQFMTSIRLRQQFSSSNYLQSGVTYTFRYKFNFDSKLYSYRKPNTWTYNLSVVNSSGASSDINAGEYNVAFSNVTNDTYALYITLTYTPNQTLKQVSLQVKFPYANTYDFGYGSTTLWQEQIFAINYKQLTITSNQDSTTTDAINNQTTIIQQEIDNTNNTIINSTENIINNQNENTQQIIDSNKVCDTILVDSSMIFESGYYLDGSGLVVSSSYGYGITDYIEISERSYSKIDTAGNTPAICFYNDTKTLISCVSNGNLSIGNHLAPINTKYFRASISMSENKPKYKFVVCKDGNQSINDTLTNTDTSFDSSDIADFINNFSLSISGPASQIVLLPINLIDSLFDDSSTSDLCFTLKGVQSCFPNGSFFWNRSGCHDNGSWFGCPQYSAFKDFFKLFAGGFIIWFLLVKIFHVIQSVLDPDKSTVEVLKL